MTTTKTYSAQHRDYGGCLTTAAIDVWPAEVWWASYCTGTVLPAGVELREDGSYRDPARLELGWCGSVAAPLNVHCLAIVYGWGARRAHSGRCVPVGDPGNNIYSWDGADKVAVTPI